MTPDEYKVLLTQIKSLQDSLNIIDKDLEHDRTELGNITIRLGTVEGELNQLRKGLQFQAEKVHNGIVEAVKPMIDSTHDLQNTIEKKKFRILKQPFSFKFWRR